MVRRLAGPVCVLLVAFECSPLSAQAGEADVVRRPTFARVEDHAGQPLCDAVVTFAGGIPHLGVEVGPRDVLQVQTDARGRAQAKLLPGLCYVAWVVGKAEADGRCAVSAVHPWFGAGALLTLRCGAPEAPVRLRVEGAAPWRSRGPLRFVAFTSVPGTETALAVSEQGELLVPPGPIQGIEVQTADGVPLLHASPAGPTLVLPPPRTVHVRARDEQGAPLAGAQVRLRVGRVQPWRHDSLGSVVEDRWRPLGVTDAEGRCEAEVPYPADPMQDQGRGDLLMFVGAPGRPSVLGGVCNGEFYVDDRKATKPPQGELVFTCKRVEPLVGAVGRAPAGTVVQLAAVCKVFLERTSYRHDARTFHAPVAPDGSFRFDDVPAELHSCRFSLVPPAGAPSLWPVFPPQRGRELPPEVKVPDPAVWLAVDQAEVTLQFLEANGGPARGVVAFLTPATNNGVLVRDAAVRFPLDARGSASLRLVPGAWAVLAWTETGWAARGFEWKAGEATETLAMQAHQQMRLELRDQRGQPIADAKVVVRGTTTRGTGDPLQSILQSLRSQWVATWNALRTDAAGRVVIPFIPVEGVTQKLGLAWDGGSTDDLVMEATEDWVAVRPR